MLGYECDHVPNNGFNKVNLLPVRLGDNDPELQKMYCKIINRQNRVI